MLLTSSTGSGTVGEEMSVAMLCEHMKWTWQEYLAQPLWLIQALRVKLKEEAEHQARESKKASQKHGKR